MSLYTGLWTKPLPIGGQRNAELSPGAERRISLHASRYIAARALGLSYTSGLTLRHLTESATLTLTLSTSLILPLTAR